MAISIRSSGVHGTGSGNWFANTTPKDTTISWQTGDVVVVLAVAENAGTTINAPAATGLSFTQRQISPGTGTGEARAYAWTAKAAGTGSSVTLSVGRGTPAINYGYYWWVLAGADDYTTGGTNTGNSGNTSLTVGSGAWVGHAMADWNAATLNPAPLTGSGTATERVDTDDAGTSYGIYIADWLGTAAGTFTFGWSPYTSMNLQSVAIAVSEGAAPPAVGPRPPIVASAAAAVRRLLATGRALLDRAPQSPAPPRRPLIHRPHRRPPSGRATIIRPAASPPATPPPPRRPLVVVGRRLAGSGRALIGRAPQQPAPPRAPLVLIGRRRSNGGRAVVARSPLPPPAPTSGPRQPLVVSARRALAAGRAQVVRAPQPPPSQLRLLNTFAPPTADPHSITITGATAGRDVWLVVNTPAVVTTPASWVLVTSRVATMASYIYRLPAASHSGGSIGVTLDLTASRALAAVAFEAPAADTGSVYASLVVPVNGPGSSSWGTGAHTFAAPDAELAIYAFHSATTPPTFNASSYDSGFTPFADTTWAGTGGASDEAVRILAGSAAEVGFTAGGVTLTLDAAGPTGSAVGFLAFNFSTEPPVETVARPHPLVIAARRAVAAGRAMVARSPLAPAPPRPPLVVGARRRPGPGRVLVERAPQAAPAAPARRPQPIVVVARARARAQEILNLRAPAPAADIVSVPAAAQVTEPRSRRPFTRPAIVTRNRTAAPATAAGPREPLVITSTRRPLSRIILRRTPPGVAPAAQAPRRPLVVTGQRPRPQSRVAVRRSPTAPLAAVVRPRVLVVAARIRRRPTVNVLLWSAPPPPPAPPGPGAQWYVSRGGLLIPYRALLDGVYPTTADVT